jgi:hypothetical protein
MGEKRATNIPGVYAPADGPERYRVARSRTPQGTLRVPFVYLSTDDLDEAMSEVAERPDMYILDTHTGQVVAGPGSPAV